METILPLINIPLISTVISSVISSVITYFLTRSRIRLDLEAEYDKDLRSKRLDAYKELWVLLKPLNKYSLSVTHEAITHEIIQDILGNMVEWYFEKGGIYLSKRSRRPYFRFKDTMKQITENKVAKIDKQLLDHLFKEGTLLRTSLANDIGTRKGSFI